MSAGAPIVAEAAGSLDAGIGQVRRELLHQLVRSKTFIVGAAIVVFWALCAILGSALVPHDPLAQNVPPWNTSPSGSHWFGTDALGRDLFARILAGSRVSFSVGLLAIIDALVALVQS